MVFMGKNIPLIHQIGKIAGKFFINYLAPLQKIEDLPVCPGNSEISRSHNLISEIDNPVDERE